MTVKKIVLLFFVFALANSQHDSFAHFGGLDKNCGHHDHKRGGYHKHCEQCQENPACKESYPEQSPSGASSYTVASPSPKFLIREPDRKDQTNTRYARCDCGSLIGYPSNMEGRQTVCPRCQQPRLFP